MSAGRHPGRPAVATRILVVEDDDDTRRGIELTLASSGFELSTASNSRDALAAAAETGPDVVVLDLGLPGVQGIEALERLREIVPEALVIVMSAWDENRYERAALDSGAALYLEKPISGARLARAVESLVS